MPVWRFCDQTFSTPSRPPADAVGAARTGVRARSCLRPALPAPGHGPPGPLRSPRQPFERLSDDPAEGGAQPRDRPPDGRTERLGPVILRGPLHARLRVLRGRQEACCRGGVGGGASDAVRPADWELGVVPPPSHRTEREAIAPPGRARGGAAAAAMWRRPWGRSAHRGFVVGGSSVCAWSLRSDHSGMGDAVIPRRRRAKGRRGAGLGAASARQTLDGTGEAGGTGDGGGTAGAGVGAGTCPNRVSSRVELTGRRVSSRDESWRARTTAAATAAMTASRFFRDSYAR